MSEIVEIMNEETGEIEKVKVVYCQVCGLPLYGNYKTKGGRPICKDYHGML